MAQQLSIGIDLGTTYSCVGTFINGTVEISPNDLGHRTTPSYVAFTEEEKLVGETAKNQISKNVANTYYGTKRLIGCKFDSREVQNEIKNLSYNVYDVNNNPRFKPMYKKEEKIISPEEIASMILGKMKLFSEDYLGASVENAVITVPAYFSDEQRSATKDAGFIAGLNVLRIINEPTAAAIAYGLQKPRDDGTDRNILVFDLGGGTFDVSILTTSDGFFQTCSTSGDTHLGGEDFDNILVDHFILDFEEKHKKKISRTDEKCSRAIAKLKAKCEEVKKSLSSAKTATLEIDSFYEGIDYTAIISRSKFEDLCKDIFKSCLEPVESALSKAKLKTKDIDDIVLVGGSTRIPKIRELLESFFNGKRAKTDINPDEAVAYGATVMAARLSGDKTKNINDIVMVDVAPLDIGVKVQGDIVEPIIKSGTSIPIKVAKEFSTVYDDQEQVEIEIYEGIGRPSVRDNKLLGKFELSGIPRMKRGEPKINIELEINADGVLVVSAQVESTDIKNKITVTNTSRLSKEEIEKMKEEAEKFKKDDDDYKMVIGVRNEFERYIDVATEKLESEEITKNLSEDKVSELKSKLIEYRTWLMENPHPDLKDCRNKLDEANTLFSEHINEKANNFDPIGLQDFLKNFNPSQMEELSNKMNEMRSSDSHSEEDVKLDVSDEQPKCSSSIDDVD